MVFAVDEGRRVYWYHPAWQNAADNPIAIDIERDEALHEFPQAITHRFAATPLQLFGVFLDRAMSVREMESLVARAPRRAAANPARPRRGGRDQAGPQPGARPMNRPGARAVSLAVAICSSSWPVRPPPPRGAGRTPRAASAVRRALRDHRRRQPERRRATPARCATPTTTRRATWSCSARSARAPTCSAGSTTERAGCTRRRSRRRTIRAVAELARRSSRWRPTSRTRARRGVPTVVYFVYAGHGNVENGRGYLALEDARLFGADLEQLIVDRVGGAETHFIVDACYSVFLAMSRGPGGERREAHGFSALGGLAARPGVGLLLSTSSARESHEWSEFQAGVFSHEVRSGLLGAADANGDGQVSYREIAAFVERANAPIPNERFRPDVYAKEPTVGAPCWTCAPGLGRRLELDGSTRGTTSSRTPAAFGWPTSTTPPVSSCMSSGQRAPGRCTCADSARTPEGDFEYVDGRRAGGAAARRSAARSR